MLYELISTMSRSEKRYFKLYAQKNGQNLEYITLFNALDSGQEWEEIIRSKKIKVDKIASTKHYLSEAILKSLRGYHSKQSKYIEVHELLTDIHILNSKGLRKEALKRLQKAKKVAAAYNYDFCLLELSILERKIVLRDTKNDAKFKAQIDAININIDTYLSNVNEEVNASKLYGELFLEMGAVIGKERKIEIDKQFTTFQKNITSFNARAYLYFLQSSYYRLTGQKKENNSILAKLVLLLEENKKQQEGDYDYVFRYLVALNNYSMSCYRCGKFGEQIKVVQKFSEVDTKNIVLQAQVFQMKYNTFLLYHIAQEDYDLIVEEIPVIESKLKRYSTHVPEPIRIAFLHNISIALFLAGKLDQAQTYIHELCSIARRNIRDDIFISLKLLEILIYFELKSDFLLENLILKYKRLLREVKSKENAIRMRIVQAIEQVVWEESKYSLLELKDILSSIPDQEVKIWLASRIGKA